MQDESAQDESAQDDSARDDSAEALDGSTHFVFEHKVFSAEGCRFEAEAGTPKFLMPLGEEMAAISLASLRQEFDLGDGSRDAKLLDIVAQSLKYVKQIRPNAAAAAAMEGPAGGVPGERGPTVRPPFEEAPLTKK